MTARRRDKRSGWIVEVDAAVLPEALIEAASASQATLGPKLNELRAVRQPFPDGDAPASAQRWIDHGGDPAEDATDSEPVDDPR